MNVCNYCPESFDSFEKLKEHEYEHKRTGDISYADILKCNRNELRLVLKESLKCKDCSKVGMCNHHDKLVSILREEIKVKESRKYHK